MNQKWIQILVIMAFYQGAASKKLMEGQQVPITCHPDPGSLIVWFRVLDQSGMKFIASFTNNGVLKSESSSFKQLFSASKGQITLKSFNKERDSGSYGCASLKGSELKFGEITRLSGEELIKPTTAAPQNKAAKTTVPMTTTTTPCVCKDKKEPSSPSMDCAPLILGPLAGGCGLLLLLLIVTILHCNKIRTRRCPHHYKRKLRTVAPEKQMMTN